MKIKNFKVSGLAIFNLITAIAIFCGVLFITPWVLLYFIFGMTVMGVLILKHTDKVMMISNYFMRG